MSVSLPQFFRLFVWIFGVFCVFRVSGLLGAGHNSCLLAGGSQGSRPGCQPGSRPGKSRDCHSQPRGGSCLAACRAGSLAVAGPAALAAARANCWGDSKVSCPRAAGPAGPRFSDILLDFLFFWFHDMTFWCFGLGFWCFWCFSCFSATGAGHNSCLLAGGSLAVAGPAALAAARANCRGDSKISYPVGCRAGWR